MASFDKYSRATGIPDFWNGLVRNYGRRLMVMLLCFYLFIKGFIASAIGLSLLPFFKNDLRVNEKTYQIYSMIAYVPWSIKAFIGSLSDLYPLYGYHAQGYMLFFSVLGSAALFLIGVLPLEGRARLLAPALIFLAMMQISVLDLLCEARYARAMKEGSAKSGGSIISFVWGCVVAGSFAASTFVGVFTDYFNAKYVYLICLPFAIYIIYPISKNFLGEKKIPLSEVRLLTEKNRKIFALAFVMAALAFLMALVNTLAGERVVLAYAILASLALCALSLATQERTKAKCNVYLFLVEATYIQIPGALDYWYTADADCLPGGPHFDMTYYLTFTSMVGAAASIAGIALFQSKMARWPFRRAFLFSSLVRVSSSFFDLFLVTRLNLRLGLPDKLAYMLGDALILNTASMLATMPAVLLTATIVNDGLESTTYAILAGFQNFGGNVSKSVGLALMAFFGVDADARPCNFERLPALIFVCHSVLPVLPVFLLPLLIDDTSPPGPEEDGAERMATGERIGEEYGLLSPGGDSSGLEGLLVSSDSGLNE